MGLYLNPGNDAFKIALNSRIYVDNLLYQPRAEHK